MSTNLEIFNAYNQALIAGDFPGVFETRQTILSGINLVIIVYLVQLLVRTN